MTVSRSDGKWSEVLRQLERALDHEVRATEEVDDKLERLLAIVVLALAGSMAVLGSLFPGPATLTAGEARLVLALSATGILSLVAAAGFLVHGYIGLTPRSGPEFIVGPDPDLLVRRSADPAITRERVLRALSTQYPAYIDSVGQERMRILRLRHRAFHLLTSGLGLLGVGRLMAWGFQL